MKHTLILVGADKGGVGKTTTSRALLDFLARKNILARAFDTENPRGTLRRFYPGITQIIDLHNVADQMKLLDTIETAPVPVTVVDLKAGNLSSALQIFRHIGVLDAAAAGDFDIGLVHVVGPSIASLDEMNEVADYTGDMAYVVARNFINETNFFEWDDDTYQKYFARLQDAKEIEIPKLNEMAYEQVDLAGVTFSDFITSRNARGDADKYSFVLRGYVRKWQSDLDAEFESLQLIKNLLAAARLPDEAGVISDSGALPPRADALQAKARAAMPQPSKVPAPKTPVSKAPATKAPVVKPAAPGKPAPKTPVPKSPVAKEPGASPAAAATATSGK